MTALQKLCLGDASSVFVVCAHPDDEVIGAGAQLSVWRNLCLVHITDGAPRDLADAHAAGFHTRTAYACARQEELRRAVELVKERHNANSGDQEISLLNLGFADQ